MPKPILLNIEEVPWQLCLLTNITEDEAFEVISQLNWYPESKNYFGIVCENDMSDGMRYNYFYTAEEAISYIIDQRKPAQYRYFLLRQMTEEQLTRTLERYQYNTLQDDDYYIERKGDGGPVDPNIVIEES